MLAKTIKLSNFAHNLVTKSSCYRPEKECDLNDLDQTLNHDLALARGAGLSYNDCCTNDKHSIINTQRLNHFFSFDKNSGVVVCQPGIRFAELFLLDNHLIPPVLPGTVHASLGGAIANDIHGKNNHKEGCFGHHIQWLELQINNKIIHCDSQHRADLFYATIGGLGLTGIIRKIALKLKPAKPYVLVQQEQHQNYDALIERIQHLLAYSDYIVAWLDLLNHNEHAVLAHACENNISVQAKRQYSLPKIPLPFINHLTMKKFNRYYYHTASLEPETLHLQDFNNPLDRLRHWNYMYGRKGLVQIQILIKEENFVLHLKKIRKLIQDAGATPTLAVLKYFSKSGLGLLSFAQPGYSLAIDFPNNQKARLAIEKINSFITELRGRVYLAKDLYLTPSQYHEQYPQHLPFKELLQTLNSGLASDLSRRLEIIL